MQTKLPNNPVSGIIYTGSNVNVLKSGEWATFLQWKKIGRVVKKGEKGKVIIKLVKIEKKVNDKLVEETLPKWYTVFQISQTEILKQHVST